MLLSNLSWNRWTGIVVALLAGMAQGAELPVVRGVELQPLAAQVKRVAQALELLGSPLSREQSVALDKAVANPNADQAVEQIQKVLDPLCLAGVNINPESRVKVAEGPAAKRPARRPIRHRQRGQEAIFPLRSLQRRSCALPASEGRHG